MDLLDCSKQCQGEPALWGQTWLVHGYSHLRLGSNILYQLPFYPPLVGCSQHGRQCRIFLLVPSSHSLRKTASVLSFASSLLFLNIGFCSTPMFGTALTFPCSRQELSITQGSDITSLGSLIPIHPSTPRHTKPTAPSSSPHRSSLPTASILQPSPPP